MKIQFVKGGELCIKSKQNTPGTLTSTRNRQLEEDFEKKLQFPYIVPTNLRTNMVLWSSNSWKVTIIELTVPSEETCDESKEKKTVWQKWSFPV